MSSKSISSAFAQAVLQRPKLSHGAVRVGLWLAAVADCQQVDTVEAVNNDLIQGIDTEAVTAPGISFRPETVRSAIESLQAAGLLQVVPCPGERFLKRFTLMV